ncbi:B3 domain-containing transcription factor VRN1 [Cannabis sativa]|uniref:B3 domain-containing transcription factor VRN1 n=1 Tax=Cannabis sativa TaxID=3483 RepID=UPI0011DFECC8|nr:B3 domain-containing transcription factor VRN1 [Cannabis sativa]XP_030479830.1 B3 domain-containing transcription factor VRN1 [Cannabis sativa]
MTSFCFFKIHDDYSMTQWALPPKFVRLQGHTLAETVSFVLPCSHKWKIGLVSKDGKLYLKEGWPEFVKHYQLSYGYMLKFTYGGRSKFNTSIYDTSTCEIDYTRFSSPNFTREKSDTEGMSKKAKAENHTTKNWKQSRHVGAYNTYEGTKAYEEASRFPSKHPVFRRILRTDKCHRYKQQLPEQFIRSYLEPKTQQVTLKVGTKQWTVTLLNCSSGFSFCAGWSKFLAANSLCTGDACVFEVLKRKPAKLRVTIFRNDDV